MTDIFISYSRRDKDFVHVLHNALSESSYETWIDWQDIPPTKDWWREIEAGIEETHTFLLVVTRNSIQSRTCRKEIAHAMSQNKRIIPVMRDNVSDLLPPELSRIQWISFRESDAFERAFDSLVETIDIDIDQKRNHTRLQLRALEWSRRQQDPSLLLRGSELEAAERWLLEFSLKDMLKPTGLQVDFVSSSAASRKRTNNLQRATIGTLVVLLSFSMGAGFLARQQSLTAQTALESEEKARKLAEQRSQESEQAREAAQAAEAEAVRQREIAEERQQEAETALALAEAAELAEAEQRRRAELGELEANRQADRAREQTELAERQTVIAEENAVSARIATDQARAQALDASIQSKALTIENMLASGLNFRSLLRALQLGKELKGLNIFNDLSHSFDEYTIPASTYLQAVSVIREAYYAEGFSKKNSFKSHVAEIWSVEFSPSGNAFASASYDGTIRLWNYENRFFSMFTGHGDGVIDIDFSHDGEVLASSSFDSTVKLWSAQDGQSLKTLEGHSSPSSNVEFSPDQRTLASGGGDGSIIFWDYQTGDNLGSIDAHPKAIRSLSYSADGQKLASGDTDGTVKIWDQSGNVIAELNGHSKAIINLEFSHDGRILSSSDYSGIIKFWLLQEEIKSFNLADQFSGIILDTAFSPAWEKIAIARNDGKVAILDIEGEEVQVLSGHSGSILSVAFSPNGRSILSSALDGTVKIWEDSDHRHLDVLSGHGGGVSSVDFDPYGEFFVSGGNDGQIKFWSINGREIQKIEGHSDRVLNIRFSPDGQLIASASADKTVKLWDRFGQEKHTLNHTSAVRNAFFSPSSDLLMTYDFNGNLKIWNTSGDILSSTEDRERSSSLEEQNGRGRNADGLTAEGTYNMSFSPDSQLLAVGLGDGSIVIFDASQNGENIELLGHSRNVWSVDFSDDGESLLSASTDGTIKIWDLKSQESQLFTGHSGPVYRAIFSPDGQLIASASADNTIKLWNLKGQELQTLHGHKDAVNSISFSPDGKSLVSASDDGAVIVWNFDLNDLLAKGCVWLKDYMENSETPVEQRDVCRNERLLLSLSSALVETGWNETVDLMWDELLSYR